MKAFLSSFWLPKAGNTKEEYEDAFSPARGGEYKGDTLRIAAADGSTEGMLSGEWAEILVKAFRRSKKYPTNISSILTRAYEGWDRWQRTYLEYRQRKNPVQWFEEAGLQRGAFSTILGLTLAEPKRDCGEWEAVALGDTCLFQIRGENLITKIPLDLSSDFNNRPFLIPSKVTDRSKVRNKIEIFSGGYQSDDRFYIMTDALACWFLRDYENGNRPWRIPRDLSIDKGQGEFQEWIDDLRRNKLIRNDDVTLIRVDIL